MISPDLITDKGWHTAYNSYFKSSHYISLCEKLTQRAAENAIIYPPTQNIFAAFNLTPFEDIRVVILGQDPYHGAEQAMGLSFSVPAGQKVPPSLRNILKELHSDVGTTGLLSGDLTPWARQGVFLLNSILTVEQKSPGAHAQLGWGHFTDRAISLISEKREGVVFLLWGAFAHQKESLIDKARHLVLKAAHPSPFSAHRGFLGCRHFSLANTYLEGRNGTPINW